LEGYVIGVQNWIYFVPAVSVLLLGAAWLRTREAIGAQTTRQMAGAIEGAQAFLKRH
jgi:hypothetical protein